MKGRMISGKGKTVGSCVLDLSFIQLHSNFFFILVINYTNNYINNTCTHTTTTCTFTTSKIKFILLHTTSIIINIFFVILPCSNLTAHLYQYQPPFLIFHATSSNYYFYYFNSRSFYFELSE